VRHQPLIPAGSADLPTAEVISNLKFMVDHLGIGDNHNASVFHQCYKRMGDFIPQFVHQGRQPRVMLEYSGCLLHGLRHMGVLRAMKDGVVALKDILHIRKLFSIFCGRNANEGFEDS
jgi:hypothetical protein